MQCVGFGSGVGTHAGDSGEGYRRGQEDHAPSPPLPHSSPEVVGENQHGTGVEVQLVQFVLEVVIEEPARRQDTGVVDQQADLKITRGLFDHRQEVLPGQIDRDDPGFDPVGFADFCRQPLQPVFTPGYQDQMNSLGGELAGKGFADAGRCTCHHGPGTKACEKIAHSMLLILGIYDGKHLIRIVR